MTRASMLSPHFSVAEFQHSETATALGIRNEMNESALAAARNLCLQILEPIQAHFDMPVRVNSGYRTLALNQRIGSKETSQHIVGEAADIEMPTGPSNADLAKWIAGSALDFDQLILEAYHGGQPRSGWVHVSRAISRAQRRQTLTMTMGTHGAVYTPGLHP